MASEIAEEIEDLRRKIAKVPLPAELLEKLRNQLDRLSRIIEKAGYIQEYESLSRYIDWLIGIPWEKKSKDILDLSHAKEVLDKNHYGLSQIKDRILEYLSVLILQKEEQRVLRAPILCLVGLVGTGKTSMAFSIAEALGRRLARIPLGGMGDPLQLRGQPKTFAGAEPGLIIKSLVRTKVGNPVILLDELDRVSEEGRADIMGALVELLDPEQNSAFLDHYIDYPVNLSEVLFIGTANNTGNIATAVLDRLEIINMPSYNDEEKIKIGKDYILPKILSSTGVGDGVLKIDDSLWPQIVRPLGFDSGMRSLERTINGIARKVARMIVEKKGTKFNISAQNIKEFLPSY